jgi:hypothetical protein
MSTVATILTASVFGAVSVLFIIGIVQNERVIYLTDEDDPDYE